MIINRLKSSDPFQKKLQSAGQDVAWCKNLIHLQTAKVPTHEPRPPPPLAFNQFASSWTVRRFRFSNFSSLIHRL